MATSAERQRSYRAKMADAGLVPLTVYVPRDQQAAVYNLANRLCDDRNLEVGPVRNVVTGKMERV